MICDGCEHYCLAGYGFSHAHIVAKLMMLSPFGATENAGVENAIRSKLQGWKMEEWKKQER